MALVTNPEKLHKTITTTSTSNSSQVITTTRKEQLVLSNSYVIVDTAIVSSGAVVMQILDGSTELATATLGAAEAVDTKVYFTAVSGVNDIYSVGATKTIKIKVKTASAGGGAAGVVVGVLCFQTPEA